MAKRKVTTIPATINKFTAKPVDSKKKRRVAGYARVSTDMRISRPATRHRQIITQHTFKAERTGSSLGCILTKASAPPTPNIAPVSIR